MSTKPAVIVIRHPDSSNEFLTQGEVDVFDIDLGRVDLACENETAEWLAEHTENIRRLRLSGAKKVARMYQDQVLLALDGFGWVAAPGLGVCLRCGHRPSGVPLIHGRAGGSAAWWPSYGRISRR